MGISDSKKGGMKKAHTHSIGPRRQLQARHPDGRPLLISLQAVPKDGSSLARLVALIKPVTPAKGSPVRVSGARMLVLGLACLSRRVDSRGLHHQL